MRISDCVDCQRDSTLFQAEDNHVAVDIVALCQQQRCLTKRVIVGSFGKMRHKEATRQSAVNTEGPDANQVLRLRFFKPRCAAYPNKAATKADGTDAAYNRRSIQMSGQFLPKGFHTITPNIVVDDAEGAVAFLKKALGGLRRIIGW